MPLCRKYSVSRAPTTWNASRAAEDRAAFPFVTVSAMAISSPTSSDGISTRGLGAPEGGMSSFMGRTKQVHRAGVESCPRRSAERICIGVAL